MSEWLDAEGHADRAFEMFDCGRWSEAEAELRKALALNPDQPEWHFNLGMTLEAAGRETDALASYQRASELMPNQPEPRVAAGIILSQLSDDRAAITYFDEALALDSSCEPAYAHKIHAHVALGDHAEAETTYFISQQALAETSARCCAAMAESLLERGEFGRAEWCLREAIRVDASLPRIRTMLATVFAMTDRRHQAIQLFLRELREDPGSIDTLLDYASLLIELGRLPEAGEKLRRVLELEPANIEAHYQHGLISMQLARLEQAQISFELVSRLDPDFPGIRRNLAEALVGRGRLAEARRCLKTEYDFLVHTTGDDGRLLIDVASTKLLTDFGQLLLDAGLSHRASTVLRHALMSDDRDVEILRRLSLARFQSGDRDGGCAMSRRLLRFDPEFIPAIHNLALAALQQGRVREAYGWIVRGLKIDRQDEGLRRLRIRVWAMAFPELMHRVWVSGVWKFACHLARELRGQLSRLKSYNGRPR